jgi:hypothetical protein
MRVLNQGVAPVDNALWHFGARRARGPRDKQNRGNIMETLEIEHFHHAQGIKPRVVVGAPADTLREVLGRVDMIKDGEADFFVFVGECEEALKEPIEVEEGVDLHEPVDIDLTLEVLAVHVHRHVHKHCCRHVLVEVKFAGATKRHKFSPATTIAVVTEWARKKFPKLDAAAAAEYVLQICGTASQPRSDEHLGEIVDGKTCSICFDLINEITPQG